MEIGQVIRTYRKKKNMTQEDMAARLGVTAPAVNKWENGNSMPDILLLAPIARLLGITVDELLSFREELTQDEINQFIQEMNRCFRSETFDQVFCRVRKYLEEYPNCHELIWQAAMVLEARLVTDKAEEIRQGGRYDDYISNCFVRALESRKEPVRVKAAESLFLFWMRREQYEKAESCLACMSDQNPEKKRKQAELWAKTGQRKEAARACEELLFSAYGAISLVLNTMYTLAAEEEDWERAGMLCEKLGQAARLFDMGRYQEVCSGLRLAEDRKDQAAATEIIRELKDCAETICDCCQSPLYGHMTFKEVSQEFMDQVKKNLQQLQVMIHMPDT